MPTQQDVKFSDYVRGLPAASESDLSAGNNMPLVRSGDVLKLGGNAISDKADKIKKKFFDFGSWELGSFSSNLSDVVSNTRIRNSSYHNTKTEKITVNVPDGYMMMMGCNYVALKVDWFSGKKELTLQVSTNVRFAIKRTDESDLSSFDPNELFDSIGIYLDEDIVIDLSDVYDVAKASLPKEISKSVTKDSNLLSSLVFKRMKTWRHVNTLQKRCFEFETENLGSKYNLSNEFILHNYSNGMAFSVNNDGHIELASSQNGASASLLVGGFNPYYFYELDCNFARGKEVGIEFFNSDYTDIIRLRCTGNDVVAERIVSGATMNLGSFSSAVVPQKLYVHYNGKYINISVGYENSFVYLGNVVCDMRSFADFKKLKFGVFAKIDANEKIEIKDVWGGISSGTGQADPVICHRSNGEPFVKDGKLYMTMTFRGYEGTDMSGACICTMDVDTYDIDIVGHLYGIVNDGKLYHVTNSCFLYNDDEKRFYLFGIVFDLADHKERYAVVDEKDVGSTMYLQYHDLGLGVNKESFDVVYNKELKKWTALYCDLSNNYVTRLLYSDSLLGNYVVQKTTEATNTTASRWVVVGGTQKVVMGGEQQTMAVYDSALNYEGELNVEDKSYGNRMWCTVVPLRCGNYTKYIMISFDRGNFAGSYSYGTTGIFEAEDLVVGSEYDYSI